jgi:hypothetical protein
MDPVMICKQARKYGCGIAAPMGSLLEREAVVETAMSDVKPSRRDLAPVSCDQIQKAFWTDKESARHPRREEKRLVGELKEGICWMVP